MSRIQHLSKPAQERGTYPIRITVKDSYGLTVNSGNIPTVFWWLTDLTGKVINNRANVEVTSISNPLVITLSNEDLQITDKERGDNVRILTLRGTYNSDLGLGLPFTHQVSFSVLNNKVIDIDLVLDVYERINSWDTVNV